MRQDPFRSRRNGNAKPRQRRQIVFGSRPHLRLVPDDAMLPVPDRPPLWLIHGGR